MKNHKAKTDTKHGKDNGCQDDERIIKFAIGFTNTEQNEVHWHANELKFCFIKTTETGSNKFSNHDKLPQMTCKAMCTQSSTTDRCVADLKVNFGN